MNVYVETNFVLEHALEQEECDSCAGILERAALGRLKLVIPAFSLAEPHQAILGKAKERKGLDISLRKHLREVGRSRPHREIPATFDLLAAALIASEQFARDGVRNTITALLRTAKVIPLDSTLFRSARQHRVSDHRKT